MDRERFERLYEEHSQPLFGFLVYRIGDRALAEDLLADTFERVLRSRGFRKPGGARGKTWQDLLAVHHGRPPARRRGAESRALERATVPAGDDSGGIEVVEERDTVQ